MVWKLIGQNCGEGVEIVSEYKDCDCAFIKIQLKIFQINVMKLCYCFCFSFTVNYHDNAQNFEYL